MSWLPYVLPTLVLTAAWFCWLCEVAPERPDLDPEYLSAADERAEWEATEADRHHEMERER